MINATNAAAIAKVATFEQSLDILAALDAAHKAIVWPKGTGSGAMGLTPDHIKFSPEFRDAHNRSHGIMTIERKFNQVFSKRFKKEIIAHRDAKRAAKNAAAKAAKE